MKRNDVLIIVSTLLYSFFFYKQMPGINYLLFSIVLVFMLGLRKDNVFADKRWMVLAALSLLTGVFVLIHGTVISVISNFIALSMLAVNSLYVKSSFFFSFFVSIFSYLSSFVYLILDLVDRKPREPKPEEEGDKKKSGFFVDVSTKLVLGIIGFLVIALFFVIYRRANPLFKDFTDRINLDFISIQWLTFTFLGFLLMYGFFKIRHDKKLHESDSQESGELNEERVHAKPNAFLGFIIPVQMEALIGVVFLAILNILLLMLNSLDLSFMFGGADLPDGITYSEYVHKGVGNLIFSVVLVILITMYFFRGQLNFFKGSGGSKAVRILAFLWLVQNLIMLISTAFRNQEYISEYSLTYKRIGVYVWLVLTAVGLITTFYKIGAKKSMWYLIRINSWSFLIVIILLGSTNWDMLIAKYNTRNIAENFDDLDFEYLMNLNSNAMPIIYEALEDIDTETLFQSESTAQMYDDLRVSYMYRILGKMDAYMEKYSEKTWKSFNLDDNKTIKKIKGFGL
ncbi:MAG: hypothetical protein C0592_01745 [Marinilabiliales bacterium]|nr:MAG: hypothetical protein C0592_01745 [Marinilabiliales bacterium]